MRTIRPIRPVLFASLVLVVLAPASQAAPIVFSSAGASAAAIQPTVDAFRSVLGNLNANNPGSVGSGRREINWDGVPAGSSAPNLFPGDFFNANTPGRARGVEFSTPGTGFQVSANAGSGTEEFNNIDPLYSSLFAPFSAQKLFTPLGSTITDVTFFVPGSDTPATTTAFGAVFTDVDQAASTSLQFFDPLGNSLGVYFVPSNPGSETLSFLGVVFGAGELISRVRINSGNSILSPGNLQSDLVVMDDFIYAEPQAVPVPEPTTSVLISLGLIGARLAGARTRRQ